MLKNLTVKNIALIESCEIEFSQGLNVLTGETGAGKSIIIDSLGFVLGDRADKTLIRHGAPSATVTAEFSVRKNDGRLKEIFEDYGIEYEEEIVVHREMTSEGANTCRVNGIKVTLGMLKNITANLADIYGQHESHALLKDSNHIEILDSFDNSIGMLKAEAVYKYDKYRNLKKQQEIYGNLNDISKKQAILEDSIKEIRAAGLERGEEEELDKLRARINNSAAYLGALGISREIINGTENDENVISMLGTVRGRLSSVEDMDTELPALLERLETAKIELADIADTIGGLLDGADFDEELAKKTEERKDLLRLLKRKYGTTVEDVLDKLEKMEAEYSFLADSESSFAKLERDIENSEKELLEAAERLSQARKKAAERLSEALVADLAEVGLSGCRLEIVFARTAVTSNGFDDVAFYISLNKGQPVKPLSKTISGGEASRFMLCLKNIIAGLQNVDTMVFDEIDTGISGKIAGSVAEKLYKISGAKQVLAVTHLPQLAAMADIHFLIKKSTDKNNTYTNIDRLDEAGMVAEIARLVGANDGSEFAVPHAKEMRKFAFEFKSKVC